MKKQSEHTAFIGNVHYECEASDLLEVMVNQLSLSPSHVRVIVDRETGRGRGFAFASFPTQSSLDHAIDLLDGYSLRGRRLRARYGVQSSKAPARPRKDGSRSEPEPEYAEVWDESRKPRRARS